ncbi:hypothetical protein [Spiroplasma sp. hyd1]|nr:hypothetical protein [Spiroplasma sp. hyd1]
MNKELIDLQKWIIVEFTALENCISNVPDQNDIMQFTYFYIKLLNNVWII